MYDHTLCVLNLMDSLINAAKTSVIERVLCIRDESKCVWVVRQQLDKISFSPQRCRIRYYHFKCNFCFYYYYFIETLMSFPDMSVMMPHI